MSYNPFIFQFVMAVAVWTINVYFPFKNLNISILGCDCGKRRSGKIKFDSKILSRNIHEKLQEDDWSGLSGKTPKVITIMLILNG